MRRHHLPGNTDAGKSCTGCSQCIYPGRFGENSIIRVKGFGIVTMNWKIYNRYGQLVFQSNTPYQGWDGTYNGVPQPMGVYAYTLEATFDDGTKTTKRGDITLIR